MGGYGRLSHTPAPKDAATSDDLIIAEVALAEVAELPVFFAVIAARVLTHSGDAFGTEIGRDHGTSRAHGTIATPAVSPGLRRSAGHALPCLWVTALP